MIRLLLVLLIFTGSVEAALRRVTFSFKPPIQAQRVSIAGTFNNWSPRSDYMEEVAPGLFSITLYLEEGRYAYKFVVNDSQWFEDPKSDDYEPDGFGGRNSVIYVDERFEKVILETGDGIIEEELIRFDAHNAFYLNLSSPRSLRVSIKTGPHDVELVKVVIDGVTYPTTRVSFVRGDLFKAYIPGGGESLFFELIDGKISLRYPHKSIKLSQGIIPNFQPPRWIKDAIMYQIFTERFKNGRKDNDPPNTREWRYEVLVPPEGYYVFYGGDLWGIVEELPYLEDLGVNLIYLNPVFTSPSNHKYNCTNYYEVDPHFGGNEALFTLIEEAKRRGIRIILDGVFNHTSDLHPFFQDVRKRGPESPYFSWYKIKKWPFPQKFNGRKAIDYYDCWWGFSSLPKLNYDNPAVRKYIMDIATYWLERGIDGWRLDVANEVPHSFWKEFRDSVKKVNPDAYIVGEIWSYAGDWLKGDEFDGVMNYVLRDAIIKFVIKGELKAYEFLRFLNEHFNATYPEEAQYSLMNLLGSHDTERFLTLANGDKRKLRLGYFITFTVPGVPHIYYGDEIGIMGGKDPDCRRVMIWDTTFWDVALLRYFKKLTQIRKKYKVLRVGTFIKGDVKDASHILYYMRVADRETLYVFLNGGPVQGTITIKRRTPLYDTMNDTTVYPDEEGDLEITLNAYESKILAPLP